MQTEMGYCAPLGIAHSDFLSWSERDQDLAIAWQLSKLESCPDCGTKESDWLDADGKYLMRPKYEVVEHRCPGCKERIARQKHLQTDERADLDGVHLGFKTIEYEEPEEE